MEILINLRKTIAAILTVTRYGPVIPKDCDITLRTFAETLANVAGTKVIHGEATVQEKQGFSKATKALLDNQKSTH